MKRVVITGLGVVSSVGVGATPFFKNLLAGRSGIAPIKHARADQLSAVVVGQVTHFDPLQYFTKIQLSLLDRFSQFALVAAKEAVADAGFIGSSLASVTPSPCKGEGRDGGKVTLNNPHPNPPPERGRESKSYPPPESGREETARQQSLPKQSGVYMGTGMGGADSMELSYFDLLERHARPGPYTVVRVMNNAAAAQISLAYGLTGPTLTYSNACSSSTISIGEAFRPIRHGYVDCVVAGGSDALLTLGTTKAWESLRTLAVPDKNAPETSCRPFAKDRSGLVLAEGAGIVILESLEHAQQRGAEIYAELVGYAANSDGSHITKPDIEGQIHAMRQALIDAHLSPREIDYINAHGTATQVGDSVETAAIKAVFDKDAYRIPISSTKSMHGHLMGATGAVEFIAAVLAMENRAIPPTANLFLPDPECDLDYVPCQARTEVEVNAVMSNSFAFGGSNAVLVARRWENEKI